MDLQVVEHDPRLVETLDAFYRDCGYLEEVAAVVDPGLAVQAWRTAQSWLGMGAHWGTGVPGASLDCVGSVVALAADVGLFKIPFSTTLEVGGVTGRCNELEQPPAVLNQRLQAYLMYACMRWVQAPYVVVPVVNPSFVHPLDIFMTPYTWSVDGVLMYPHAMICIGQQKFLTANPGVGQLMLSDVEEAYHLSTCFDVDVSTLYSFVLRFFKCATPDDVYEYHRNQVVELARSYNKEAKTA